jgi:hypothetical protein
MPEGNQTTLWNLNNECRAGHCRNQIWTQSQISEEKSMLLKEHKYLVVCQQGSYEALELRKSCNSRNKVDIVSQKLRENDWEYRKARNTLHACSWSCSRAKQLPAAVCERQWWNKSSCRLPLPLSACLLIASGRQISLRCFAEVVFQFRRPRYV